MTFERIVIVFLIVIVFTLGYIIVKDDDHSEILFTQIQSLKEISESCLDKLEKIEEAY